MIPMYAYAPSQSSAPLFPLFADLGGRAVLVVGGGKVARRKVEALLEAGAAVTIVAAALEPGLNQLALLGRIRQHRNAFDPAQLDGVWLVVAASDDRRLNREVADAAAARQIFANVVDDAELSSVHAPARVRRGHLQVAVSTRGAAPALARRLRERLEAELDESLGALTALLAAQRARIRSRFPRPGQRRRFFERLLDDDLPRLLRAGEHDRAHAYFEAELVQDSPAEATGSVTLVGAGPGDPALLTLKALRALQAADVILHDRLVGPGVLELARRDAERVDVGKRVGGDHPATQDRIHALMLQHARAGRRVVRLQGGDPLVFGRGGEELDFLHAHGIPCEVVPGITAALGCAADAGIALTDRRHARGVTLLSGRDVAALDRAPLAAADQTLAIYMGAGELDPISRTLIAHGRTADTPCVVIENGTLPERRILAGTLAGLPALARAQGVHAPALLIVGEVAAGARRATRAERCRNGASPVACAA